MKRRQVIVGSATLVAGCTGPVADDGEQAGTESDSRGVSYAETAFQVVAVDCGVAAEDATVSFDSDGETMRVEGTTTGTNACYSARVADATYDSAVDEFELVVAAYSDAAPDEACADCITEVDYDATARFNGGLPGRVVVVHRSRGDEREVETTSP